MKKIISILFALGLAATVLGCAMAKQSGQTHNAIENEVCDVHKVIVSKANGIKTVTVVVAEDVTDEQKAQIDELAKKYVPDANKVEIKRYMGKKDAQGNIVERAQ
jgi:F0F1-type ATP synthase delta subunit